MTVLVFNWVKMTGTPRPAHLRPEGQTGVLDAYLDWRGEFRYRHAVSHEWQSEHALGPLISSGSSRLSDPAWRIHFLTQRRTVRVGHRTRVVGMAGLLGHRCARAATEAHHAHGWWAVRGLMTVLRSTARQWRPLWAL